MVPFPFSTSLVSYGTAHRQGALATGGELCNVLQGDSVWYDVTVAFFGFLPEVIQISGRVYLGYFDRTQNVQI